MPQNQYPKSFVTISKFRDVLIYTFLFILSLYLSLQSHFMPYSDFNLGHDAGIFAYIGFGMKKGLVLYTELWENKGPLLYIINFFGVLLHERYGIYLFELLSLFIAVLFAYNTARLFAGRSVSVIAVTYAFLMLPLLLERGNLSEEYALPFICAGIYILSKFYFQGYSLKWYQCATSGAMFAGAFLLRANLIAAFAAFGLVLIIVLIAKRNYIAILKYGFLVLTGMISFALPIAIYLYRIHALTACLNSAYLGVMKGFNPPSAHVKLKVTLQMMAKLNNSYLYILLLFFIVTAVYIVSARKQINTERLLLLISSSFSFALNIYANSISGVYHPHYYMSFIPIILIPSVIFWDILHKLVLKLLLIKYKKSFALNVASIAVITGICLFLSLNNIRSNNRIITASLQKAATIQDTRAYKLSYYIEKNTGSDDRIYFLTYSGATTVLYRAKRLSASKYSYLPINLESFAKQRKKEMVTEAVNELLQKPPVMLVVDPLWYEKFLEFLDNRQQWDEFIKQNYIEAADVEGFKMLKLINIVDMHQ